MRWPGCHPCERDECDLILLPEARVFQRELGYDLRMAYCHDLFSDLRAHVAQMRHSGLRPVRMMLAPDDVLAVCGEFVGLKPEHRITLLGMRVDISLENKPGTWVFLDGSGAVVGAGSTKAENPVPPVRSLAEFYRRMADATRLARESFMEATRA